MVAMLANYPAGLYYEAAFNASPNQSAVPPLWSDLSPRTTAGAQDTQRGRQYELDTNSAGTWNTALENKDGALDPTNTASPFAPGVVPFRACRIRAVLGANFLTPDQATAGDASGYLGAIPVQFNVGNDAGYATSIVTSGSAYQGTRTYQAVVPTAQGAGTTVLIVTSVPVVPNTAYSFSAQVRIASGTSTATSLQVVWFDQNGNQLSTATGASATPTSGSSTWIALGASGSAPPTALSASLRVQIASGSTAATTTWQIDALQWEQSASVTTFQVPQTLGANLLPRPVATGLASISIASDSAANWFFPVIGSVALAQNLTAAPNGATTAVAWTSPAGTTNLSPLYGGVVNPAAPSTVGPVADCVQATAGLQYTLSAYFMRVASADATVQVQISILWFDVNGNTLSTASSASTTVPTVGSWVRATVTGTAPAGAAWGRPRYFVQTPATTTAVNTIYATGWQVEQAAAASTWVDPGPSYQIINGAFERYPQTWTMNGTYGVVSAIGVDQLAAIAQYTLQGPLIEECLALNPNFLYALNDPAGSASCADLTGKRIAAPIENSPSGAGSLTLGNSVTAASTAGLMLGTSGPVATFNNPLPNPSLQTFISLHKTTTRPGPPTTGAWTRMIAFRSPTTPPPTDAATFWFGSAPSYSSDESGFSLTLLGSTGQLNFAENGAAGQPGPFYNSASSVCDGNWHLIAFQFEGNGYFDVYLDGVQVYRDNNSGAGWVTPTNQASDVLGSLVGLAPGVYGVGYAGDLAMAAEFPTALTAAQHANLYNSFRSASSGESTGARARRLLTWIGWVGATAIDNGQTTNMGPATDLTGATALDALNAIALTENGNAYASGSGAITLASRTRRYNQQLPTYVFGEHAALGEWPYVDVEGDFDPTHLFNIIQVTQASTGQVFTAQDAASQAAYYPRLLQRTINPALSTEAQDAANYLLGQYKTARLRIENLTLEPGAVPGLFAVCLALEIGTRIRVMRRPPSAPPIQFDGFVEAISWTIDPDSGDATVQLQCSPADLSNYWVLGALHTTLNAQAASGQNQATINALPDAAVNMLSQSLPRGYQLTFEPGTPRAETLTLAATGIPATTIGYQSAVVTFTGNFAFTHAANTVVCEPLPATITDPTTYDSSSVLGAASCAVVSGGASGTATVTVGPLGDAKTNALGSDWNVGDLLSISPGTPNWEGYNLLTPNQSTAGEGVLALPAGTNGSTAGITSALGTASVTASGTAQQGANVWQVPVSGGASLLRLLRVNLAPAAPGLAHTWSVYVRSVTSGANPVVNAQIIYFDINGNTLATTNGGTSALTGSATATWTRVSVTATAPAGTVWASLGVPLNATAPAGAWNFQADALQWEQAAAASTYCTTPQVKSVATSAPGYSTVQLTLNTNLLNNHSAGDTVCDPLPPGVTAPPTGTTRLAY